MEVKAIEKHLRMSPRKVRLVLDMVRGKQVDQAIGILKLTPKGSAEAVSKAINSAAANAENNFGLAREGLYITTAIADKGVSRRWRKMGARSRVKPIEHRYTHITVGVSEKES
ncbi:MAG: 50S ribosomal protein L22 [Chloroflexi bacterium]|nr:50S ribosomal protein L22 [Chloroflexota bacterium]